VLKGTRELIVKHQGRRARLLAAVAGPVVAGAVLAGTAAVPAWAQQSSEPACGSSFDPYAYTASQVAACGYPVYPAQAVTGATEARAVASTAGSGSAVQYDLGNGVIVRQLIPPAGFVPETAPAAELAEYGFPARPSGGESLTVWQQEMSAWTGSAPPPRRS
jgi:hypothetical protein